MLSCLLCYCCKWCCFKNRLGAENVKSETDRRLIRTPVINRNEQMVNGISPTHSLNPAIVNTIPSVPSVPSSSFVPTVPVITPIVPIKTETISPKTNKINTQTSLAAVDSTNQVITGRFNQIESNTNNTNTNFSVGAIDNKNLDTFTNTKIESQ